MVVPERYDKKDGNIGRMQGDKNEPNPANAETKMLVSTIIVPVVTLVSKIRVNYRYYDYYCSQIDTFSGTLSGTY
jgi:hypothetical protein